MDRNYRYYVLFILMLTYLISVSDRMIISILAEDLKAEFALSDAELGLLAGLAFTLFYAGLGLPVARLADRANRRNIVAASVSIWSLMTALCGAATGFFTLFLARLGVGVGEAGGSPPAISMLSDYFDEHELGRALGVYALGATLGMVLGLMAGGLIADAFGWRMTFVLLGLPGLVLGAVLWLTVREPPRGQFASGGTVGDAGGANDPPEPLRGTMRSLARNRVFVSVIIANGLAITVSYAFSLWMAPLMIRTFGIGKTDTGLYLGLAFLIGGTPGFLLGGLVTDWLVRFDQRWRAWLPAILMPISLPLFLLSLAADDLLPMLVWYTAGYGLLVAGQAPTLSLMQMAVKPGERALAAALTLFMTNVMGQAIGPFLVGSLSDALTPRFGSLALGYSVSAICILLIPATLTYLMVAREMVRPGARS